MDSNEVIGRLDALIRLAEIHGKLTALAVCGDRTQREKIAILNQVGLEPREIAALLGTTRNTVSVALVGLHKKRRNGKGAKRAAVAAVEDGSE